jgi:hypothetical protein
MNIRDGRLKIEIKIKWQHEGKILVDNGQLFPAAEHYNDNNVH